MNDFDFSRIDLPTPDIAMPIIPDFNENLEKIQRLMNEKSEYDAKKDAALFETAESSKAQKELLEAQLFEVKEQNAQLKENYDLLKQLYEKTKEEANSSAKEARSNKIFAWVSFGVGTLIGIAGIIFGIIF